MKPGEMRVYRDLDPTKSMDQKLRDVITAFTIKYGRPALYVLMNPRAAQELREATSCMIGVMREVSYGEFYVSAEEPSKWGVVVSVGNPSNGEQRDGTPTLTEPVQARSQSFRKPVKKRKPRSARK